MILDRALSHACHASILRTTTRTIMLSNAFDIGVFVRYASLLLLSVLSACDGRSTASLVSSGKELSAKREHAAAVIQFKSAVQQSPDVIELRLLLGQAMLAAGDAAGAEIEFVRALEAKTPPGQVLPLLAKAMVMQGDYKKLVLTYGTTSLSDKPAQAAFQTQLAIAWSALFDRAKTEAALAAAIAAVPDYGPATLLRARFLAGKKQFSDASKLVEAVLARDPTDHEAWQLRGELHNATGNAAGAEEAFRKALALDKTFIPAHQSLVAVQLKKQDVAGARKQAELLRTVAPLHPTTAYIDASIAYVAGEFARARELAQRLLLVAPDQVNIVMLAGAIEDKLGSVAQAAAYFGKVLSFNPELTPARLNLAEAEIRLGQYGKALETLKPLTTANSNEARAFGLAANAEMRQGNAEAAERLFLRASKIEPGDVQLQTAAIAARLGFGDPSAVLGELQTLAESSKEAYADEALFAARVKRGEFDAALIALDGLSRKRPGLAAHTELRGRVLLAKRDFSAARLAFEQAYKADPGLVGALGSLVAMDLDEKQPLRAIERLQAVISASPQNAAAIVLLADVKAKQGASAAEVTKLLASAVSAAPTWPEPRLRQINFALQKRNFKDALTLARDALAALPGNTQILETAGRAQLQAGDTEQALSSYRRLAGTMPNAAMPYLRLSEAYAAGGKAEQAENSINKALELEPGNPDAQSALFDYLTATGRRRNALEHVQRIRSAQPNAAFVYAMEAALHVKAKNPEAALAALRAGLAKTGSSDLAGRQFSLLVELGRNAEADRFASAWIKQHPQDAAFEYLMSVQEIAKGDFRTAETRLKRVVAVYPSNTLVLNNLGWVMVQNGSAKSALPLLQQAIQMAPDAAALHDTLAFALAADKQFARALEVQKRAVAMAPEDNQLRLGLGRIAIQAGDKALARTELLRLQALGASFAGQAAVGNLLQGL